MIFGAFAFMTSPDVFFINVGLPRIGDSVGQGSPNDLDGRAGRGHIQSIDSRDCGRELRKSGSGGDIDASHDEPGIGTAWLLKGRFIECGTD